MKTLLAALVALLLVAGLVACGGGDDADTGSTEAAQAETTPADGNGSADGGDVAEAGDEGEPKRDGANGSDGGAVGGSAEFTPKQHEDSGGGSDQFRVKGGDNSVQEFGAEADTEEFDEAAVTLHNFLDARAAGAWASACRHIAASVVDSLQELATQAQRLKGSDCAAILARLTNPAAKGLMREEAEAADVGSLRIEGERAFVLFRGPEGEVLAMPMAREDGAWKVAALASTPLS